MIFNSYVFIFLFLPATFFCYFYLLKKRLVTGAKSFLVFSSLFFYSWWNIDYLPIILCSMLFNYVIGNSLNDNLRKFRVHKRFLLAFGIIVNISLLGYFKYSDFLIENFNLAFDGSVPLLHLALPLAISFFTFQQIAYLVDSYRGETTEYDFLNYSLFVTFFPQLIAGPIVHHAEMMPQFASKWNLVKKYKNIAIGLLIFSIGLFKKVVIADTFAQWATVGFDQAVALNFFEAWATSLSYTFQLYFDFSGYTDMAIGAALLFNIKLPINFNSPYKAYDIQDFWRRWHISVSRFLRDYVYIALGGNRKGTIRAYNNVLATFIIGGLWHGAGWTFVFWGLLHGVALSIHRFWKQLGFTLPKIIAWFITFNFVNIAWVFFRAKEWGDAIKVLSGMFSIQHIEISKPFAWLLNSTLSLPFYKFMGSAHKYLFSLQTVAWLLAGFVIVKFMKNSTEIAYQKELKIYQAVFIAMSVLFFHFLSIQAEESPFLYFNF